VRSRDHDAAVETIVADREVDRIGRDQTDLRHVGAGVVGAARERRHEGFARRAHVAPDADVLAVEDLGERAPDRVGDIFVELRRNDAADVVTLEDRSIDVGAHGTSRFRRAKWRNLR